MQKAAEKAGVQDLVQLHGRVSQRESWAAIKGADLVAVISSVQPSVSLGVLGNLPGKVFEVLGLGRPILVIAPEGSQLGDIVESCGAGKRFRGDDVRGIADFLRSVARGEVSVTDARSVDYSWPILIQRLDQVLRKAAGLPMRTSGSEEVAN